MSETGYDENDLSLRLPPHGRRLAAFLIDSALAGGALVISSSIAVLADASAGAVVGTVLLVALVAGATGGFITWLSGGWTWGKAWAGLQVRHAGGCSVDPTFKDLPKLMLRNTVGYVGIDVLLLGCLNALRDPRRRPVHDWVLGYDVVALAGATSVRERLSSFWEDLKAGQTLIREQWGFVGLVLAVYAGVVTEMTKWVTSALQVVGIGAPSTSTVSTTSLAAAPVAVPTAAGATAVGVGGTALAGATIVGLGVLVAPSAATYPDDLTLIPAVQYEARAYPMGLPPDLEVEIDRRRPASVDELPLDVVTAASHATVTLKIAEGSYEGATFRFDDVLVPTEVAPDPEHGTDVVSWSNLTTTTEDDGGFILEGMVVADIRRVDHVTYAGYRVARPGGTMRLSFPYRGDGAGGLDEIGIIVEWQGDLECVVVEDDPADNFDPYENCDDKTGSMYWVWGANNVIWR